MKRDRKVLIRILVGLTIFAAAMILFYLTPLKWVRCHAEGWRLYDGYFYLWFVPFLAAYLIVGYDVLLKAGRNLFTGRLLDENFLMTVATFGAIALLDLPEACGVMLFYQVGELFQRYAVGKSRRSITALMNIRPDRARVLREGEEVILPPEEVEIGDILILRAGERVPVDCVAVEGEGSLDVSSLTGESLPRAFSVGDEVLGGSVNLSGEVKLRAIKRYGDSTVARILELVENASAKKAKTEHFITKFAHYYTPIVVGAALLIGVLPPIFLGQWGEWIKKALTFLVVSCPCALVISVPLSFFGGIGGASKRGILIKGGNALEALAKADLFLFDKTGTITKGIFEVTEVIPADRREEILAAAAIAEGGSNHPIAQSILRYAPEVDREGYSVAEIAGRGVVASGEKGRIVVGNAKLLDAEGVSVPSLDKAGTALYVAKEGEYLGAIVVADVPKENAASSIAEIRRDGSRAVMLTGDREEAAACIAEEVGVDEFAADLLPQDKVAKMEGYLTGKKDNKSVCFVGDGINDAPVIALADVGIAMGGIGSDAAIEAADVVLMKDDLSAVPEAKRAAKKTMRIVRENIGFALGVKGAVLLLTALGLMGAFAMWLAVFADVGVAVIAILNAMRTLK